jgi:hypothetical protein
MAEHDQVAFNYLTLPGRLRPLDPSAAVVVGPVPEPRLRRRRSSRGGVWRRMIWANSETDPVSAISIWPPPEGHTRCIPAGCH